MPLTLLTLNAIVHVRWANSDAACSVAEHVYSWTAELKLIEARVPLLDLPTPLAAVFEAPAVGTPLHVHTVLPGWYRHR